MLRTYDLPPSLMPRLSLRGVLYLVNVDAVWGSKEFLESACLLACCYRPKHMMGVSPAAASSSAGYPMLPAGASACTKQQATHSGTPPQEVRRC